MIVKAVIISTPPPQFLSIPNTYMHCLYLSATIGTLPVPILSLDISYTTLLHRFSPLSPLVASAVTHVG